MSAQCLKCLRFINYLPAPIHSPNKILRPIQLGYLIWYFLQVNENSNFLKNLNYGRKTPFYHFFFQKMLTKLSAFCIDFLKFWLFLIKRSTFRIKKKCFHTFFRTTNISFALYGKSAIISHEKLKKFPNGSRATCKWQENKKDTRCLHDFPPILKQKVPAHWIFCRSGGNRLVKFITHGFRLKTCRKKLGLYFFIGFINL